MQSGLRFAGKMLGKNHIRSTNSETSRNLRPCLEITNVASFMGMLTERRKALRGWDVSGIDNTRATRGLMTRGRSDDPQAAHAAVEQG